MIRPGMGGVSFSQPAPLTNRPLTPQAGEAMTVRPSPSAPAPTQTGRKAMSPL